MREIKFRKWYLGDMDYSPGIWADGEGQVLVNHYFESNHEGRWMQYAGCEDKDGKAVYESDVVELRWNRYVFTAVVKFGEYEQDGSGFEYAPSPCYGFYADAISEWDANELGKRIVPDYMVTASLRMFDGIKVIGNIYENPELLEVRP